MQFSWHKLNKPVLVLAPMEDVTDCAFREMFAKYGKPDVMFTEFVSVDGLFHETGREKLKVDLAYTEAQRPIVGQIWGTDPEKFYRVAQYLVELGFDAIDINMGCPQTKEIQAGACAALIRTPKLAQEIVAATKKGAGNLEVSVKTRIGYSKPEEMEDWVKALLQTEISALTLHARTKKEMSKVPAHWDKIAEAVKIRDAVKSSTLILGNGDIRSLQEGLGRVAQTGCDGIMVGRGVFGNPWFFNRPNKNYLEVVRRSLGEDRPLLSPLRSAPFQGILSHEVNSLAGKLEISPQEKLRVMLEHAELFEKLFAGKKSFMVMRKHFKAYCSGFPGASELRAELMEAENLEQTRNTVNQYLSKAPQLKQEFDEK